MNLNNFTQMELYFSMKRSKGVAYLLLFLLGGLGIHRLYLKDYSWFLVYITLFLLGLAVSSIFTFLQVVLFLFDIYYTSVICNKYNNKLRKDILGGNL